MNIFQQKHIQFTEVVFQGFKLTRLYRSYKAGSKFFRSKIGNFLRGRYSRQGSPGSLDQMRFSQARIGIDKKRMDFAALANISCRGKSHSVGWPCDKIIKGIAPLLNWLQRGLPDGQTRLWPWKNTANNIRDRPGRSLRNAGHINFDVNIFWRNPKNGGRSFAQRIWKMPFHPGGHEIVGRQNSHLSIRHIRT